MFNSRVYIAILVLLLLISVEECFGQAKMIVNGKDTVYYDAMPDEQEYKILTEFYNSLNGKRWKKKTNWLKGRSSRDMAKWYGVVVRDGDVSEIHLPHNLLKGKIPKSVYKLIRLRALSVDGNSLAEEPWPDLTYKEASMPGSAYALASPTSVGVNLPVWGLAVDGNHVVGVDFRNSTVKHLPNSGVSRVGPSGVAITPCGAMSLYFLHSGIDKANALHIYKSDGTRLTDDVATSDKRGLNAAAGNIELQVVPVPGTTDEWFVIYSSFYAICQLTPPSSNYCDVKPVYSRIKYNAEAGLSILSRETTFTTKVFTQGKAVSRSRSDSSHYLYMAERYSNAHIKINRFVIDKTGVHPAGENATLIPAQLWVGGISGSTVELSPDETKLAITNRNVGNHIYQDLIIFDLDKFNTSGYVGSIISLPELMIAGTGRTIREASIHLNRCFMFLKNKISQVEFSPSGQYLYLTHGGYPSGSSKTPYSTYLLQIDLNSGTGLGDYDVRMLIERGYGLMDGDTDCLGTPGMGDESLWISQIQTAFNGRLYFTKRNSSKLYVIPRPDEPLDNNMVPGVVDLSNSTFPNIDMPAGEKVLFIPENIDGYNYITQEANINSDFTMNNSMITLGEELQVTISNLLASHSYQLSWGDGTVETFTKGSSTTVTKVHKYDVLGSLEVRLMITNPHSCSASTTKALSVITCAFQSNLSITHKQYRCATKFKVTKEENCNAKYLWDFGDGTQSTERSPMHVYGGAGTYNVSVSITFNCDACRQAITPLVTTVTIAPLPPPSIVEEVIQLTTEEKTAIISSSATSFSETWPLDHQEPALEDLNEFVNGSQGVWRNEGSFVYQKERSSSVLKTDPQPAAQVDLKTDGTYNMLNFNWANSYLEAVPDWIKVNTMTRYNAYGYELENKDPLNIYSGALYDYGGQLQSAYGVNMRNDEMAFTSFETNGDLSGGDAYENKPSGNLVFGKGVFPAYSTFDVKGGRAYVAIVEGKFQDFEKAQFADITARGYANTIIPFFKTETRYVQHAAILCKEPHPNNADQTILVFDKAPFDDVWKGRIRIANKMVPVLNASVEVNVAHTGKKSLKITADQSFEQKLLHLDSGKSYHFSAWVTVPNALNVTVPKLADRLAVDIILKDATGKTTSITSMVPEGKIIEGWQQVKGSFICSQDGLVLSMKFKRGTATSAYFDDIRLHPDDGNMKSYVYNLTDLRLQAILDENNFASMFYYDVEGNLYLTKKETEEGIKTITENLSFQVGDHK